MTGLTLQTFNLDVEDYIGSTPTGYEAPFSQYASTLRTRFLQHVHVTQKILSKLETAWRKLNVVSYLIGVSNVLYFTHIALLTGT